MRKRMAHEGGVSVHGVGGGIHGYTCHAGRGGCGGVVGRLHGVGGDFLVMFGELSSLPIVQGECDVLKVILHESDVLPVGMAWM
jgi:hypothetical protein